MFNITLVGDRELVAKIDAMPAAVHATMLAKVTTLVLKLEGHVKADKLSGQVLNVKTGNLRASIHSKVTDSGETIWGIVYSDGSVKYAGIHEFGGTIKHPGGTAYLPFGDTGQVRFISNQAAAEFKGDLPRTKAHDIPMPERSFLRSGLKDMEPEISRELKAAYLQGIKNLGIGQTRGAIL